MNKAAERLRKIDPDGAITYLLDKALAAERRATVERIRSRLDAEHGLSGSGLFAIDEADLTAILDEEAAR